MRRIILLLAVLFVTAPVFAQRDADWDSRLFNVGEFDRVKLEGGFHVFLIQGNENLVEVRTTDSDVFDQLEIDNEGTSLRIKEKIKPFNFDRVNLYITFQTLESIEIEGGVNMETTSYIDLQDFSIGVEGGAKIDLKLNAEDVVVTGEGGVLFELTGEAKTLNVRISGAGHVDAEDLRAEDVVFRVEGVGTGSVYATGTLDARIEGAGKISYRGNPTVTKYIEGLGAVSAR